MSSEQDYLRIQRNIGIISRRMEQDLELGFQYIEEQLRSYFKGLMGAVLNAIILMFYRFMAKGAIISRARNQLKLLITCSTELAEGAAMDGLISKYFQDYLWTEESYVRANRAHPEFQKIPRLLLQAFSVRVEFISRLLSGTGECYEDLVRSSITLEQARNYASQQFQVASELIQLIKQNPRLLKIPGILRGFVFNLLESGMEWWRNNVNQMIDQIFQPSS